MEHQPVTVIRASLPAVRTGRGRPLLLRFEWDPVATRPASEIGSCSERFAVTADRSLSP